MSPPGRLEEKSKNLMGKPPLVALAMSSVVLDVAAPSEAKVPNVFVFLALVERMREATRR